LIAATAHAQDWRETSGRVIWVRGSNAYVAADSGVLMPGMPVQFRKGKREVAHASVQRLLEPGLAVTAIPSGALDRERKLEQLRVWVSDVPAAPHITLRVGLPAPERSGWLFTCRAPHWNEDTFGAPYQADTLSHRVVRLVRATGALAAEPDTLLVRFFADAADEEIALERGELDAAVFWPGELSSRMRSDARWREPVRARRTHGVLACEWSDTLVPDPEVLAALQDGVFGGDLEAIALAPAPGAAPPRLARLEPDPRLPGAAAITRALARPGSSGPALKLSYLPDGRADAIPAGSRGLFAMRCVVVTSQALRAGWPGTSGAQELANLLQCGSPR
jgi:hypothetical protein